MIDLVDKYIKLYKIIQSFRIHKNHNIDTNIKFINSTMYSNLTDSATIILKLETDDKNYYYYLNEIDCRQISEESYYNYYATLRERKEISQYNTYIEYFKLCDAVNQIEKFIEFYYPNFIEDKLFIYEDIKKRVIECKKAKEKLSKT